MFEKPLCKQHHENALAAPLSVPDDAPFAFSDAFLCRLHTGELMRTRYFFVAFVEDDEVADQVKQAGLFAHFSKWPIEQHPAVSGAGWVDFHSTKNSSLVVTVP